MFWLPFQLLHHLETYSVVFFNDSWQSRTTNGTKLCKWISVLFIRRKFSLPHNLESSFIEQAFYIKCLIIRIQASLSKFELIQLHIWMMNEMHSFIFIMKNITSASESPALNTIKKHIYYIVTKLPAVGFMCLCNEVDKNYLLSNTK